MRPVEYFYDNKISCKTCGLCVPNNAPGYKRACAALKYAPIPDTEKIRLTRCPALLAPDATYYCDDCDEDILMERELAMEKVSEAFKEINKGNDGKDKEHPLVTRSEVAARLHITIPEIPHRKGMRVYLHGQRGITLCPECYLKRYGKK